MSRIKKIISRKMDKAIFQFNLLSDNDHVVIGLSGGKDSMALARILTEKAFSADYPVDFSVEAVYVRTDFDSNPENPEFLDIAASWGLKVTVIDVPVRQRLKSGYKLNCWWCSSQRRMELARYAENNGGSIVALGHHLDDILETFFMNMSGKGELSTMLPKMEYDRYSHTVIRPLAWVYESEIVEWIAMEDLETFTCSCAWDSRSPRKTARRAIEVLTEGNPGKKDIIFRAMLNPVQRYLPSGQTLGRLPQKAGE